MVPNLFEAIFTTKKILVNPTKLCDAKTNRVYLGIFNTSTVDIDITQFGSPSPTLGIPLLANSGIYEMTIEQHKILPTLAYQGNGDVTLAGVLVVEVIYKGSD